jgi:hypothetical protein
MKKGYITTTQAVKQLKMSRPSFYNYVVRLKLEPEKEADVVKNVIRSLWKEEDVEKISDERDRRRAKQAKQRILPQDV